MALKPCFLLMLAIGYSGLFTNKNRLGDLLKRPENSLRDLLKRPDYSPTQFLLITFEKTKIFHKVLNINFFLSVLKAIIYKNLLTLNHVLNYLDGFCLTVPLEDLLHTDFLCIGLLTSRFILKLKIYEKVCFE